MNMPNLPVQELIASVDRELSFRRRCYPRWVLDRKMTQQKADHEIACMERIREVLATLDADLFAEEES